jgi:N-acetylglutamate synthase-like GNAT family acetyltransferase
MMNSLRDGDPNEQMKGEFLISTDRTKLDIEAIHSFLASSYWSKGISRETVARAIENSLCFGIYAGKQQIGFARAISDFATFAYLADVFILETYRGRGLGKWLMEFILQRPQLSGLRRWTLATRDAHGLYALFGFRPLEAPERWMEILDSEVYMRALSGHELGIATLANFE